MFIYTTNVQRSGRHVVVPPALDGSGTVRGTFCIINWLLAALTPTHSPNNCSCARAPDSYGRQNIPHWTLPCAHYTYCTPSRTLHLRSTSILSSHLHVRAQCNFLSLASPRKYFPLVCNMRATRPVNIMKLNNKLQMPICSAVCPQQYTVPYRTVWWPTDHSQRPPAAVTRNNKCRVSNSPAAGTSRYRCVLT